MVALPVLAGGELCEGCGRCCDKIGLPPFEAPNPDLGPLPVAAWKRAWGYDKYTAQQLTDTDTFQRMPPALRADHARLVRGLTADPSMTACAWLDPDTKRCRHYEYRPAVCRDWKPGERDCLQARSGRGTVVWRGDALPALWRNPRRDGQTPWQLVKDRVQRWRWKPRRMLADCGAETLIPVGPATRAYPAADWRRGPVWFAVLLAAAVVAAPWMAKRTARELRRGWWAVRDLWTPEPDRFGLFKLIR